MNEITTTEAAFKWGVKKRTVVQWIRRGKLKAEKFGRDYMIPNDAERPERKKRW